MKNFFITAALCGTSLCFANDDLSYNAIAQRLMPDALSKAQASVIDSARPHRGGNEVVSQFCIVCHGIGAAGAPKIGCASAWTPRKAKGIKILLKHAQTGYHFMPAKGTCMDCADDELEEAIHYMINHSSKDDATCKNNA